MHAGIDAGIDPARYQTDKETNTEHKEIFESFNERQGRMKNMRGDANCMLYSVGETKYSVNVVIGWEKCKHKMRRQ